jgi:hypothetical protein
MTANPEQSVLDAIDELVDWQLEEGRRRGDGPEENFEVFPGLTTEQWRTLNFTLDKMPAIADFLRRCEAAGIVEITESVDRFLRRFERGFRDAHVVAKPCGDSSSTP